MKSFWAILLVLMTTPAMAEDWSYSAGGGTIYEPLYEGARNYTLALMPEFDAKTSDIELFLDEDGLGINPVHSENYDLGIALNYEQGRRVSDDRRVLAGTGNVDNSLVGSILGDVTLWDAVELDAGITSALSGDYGTTASLRVKSGFPVSDSLMLTGSAGLTWGDEVHMRNSFGIDAAQATHSGYQQYHVSAGLEKTDMSIGAIWALSPRVDFETDLIGSWLLGNAAGSPIVSNHFQPAVMSTIICKF